MWRRRWKCEVYKDDDDYDYDNDNDRQCTNFDT